MGWSTNKYCSVPFVPIARMAGSRPNGASHKPVAYRSRPLHTVSSMTVGETRTVYATLALATAASAFLTAYSRSSSWLSSLAWVSLLPMLASIRFLPPSRAAVNGAWWGACLFGFFTCGFGARLEPSWWAFLLLVLVPAAYSAAGAWITRRAGFSPLTLGVGWAFAELLLAPTGVTEGLLGGALGDGLVMSAIGHALGYVLVAFVVAYVNAAIFSAASSIRISTGSPAFRSAAKVLARQLTPQMPPCLPISSLQASQTRAPPTYVAYASQFMMG